MDGPGILREYIRENSNLNRLQLRERTMPMIPVILPGGNSIYLSSGGQNLLVKAIVEEFCPRFTPGGKVVYLGHAGDKISAQEANISPAWGLIWIHMKNAGYRSSSARQKLGWF